ncbi:MAG: hypothetical protein GF398_14160 [Chitinivibrionales bacterium]|nr:hypothetical protein [Chitinivibrionales bacterium]
MNTRSLCIASSALIAVVCLNTFAITKPGEIAVPEEPNNMCIAGDYLYVACTDSGLRIYDVSEATSAALVGSYDSTTRQEGFDDVIVSGDYAYCSKESGGIRILNVSNPAAPALADLASDGGGPCIALSGNYAFVGNTDGCDVYSVGTIGASERLTRYYLNADSSNYEYAEDIEIQGTYAYIAYEDSGLHIFDISSPASPVSVGRYSEADGMRLSGVAVSSDYAYLSTPDEGVKIIDISNPAAPQLAGSYNKSMGGGDAWGVEAVGTTVYLLYQEWGVYVIDVSDPASPAYVAKYPGGIAFNGDYRYMAVSETMIYMYYDESKEIYVLDAGDDVAVRTPFAVNETPGAAVAVQYLKQPLPAFRASNLAGSGKICFCSLFSLDGRLVARSSDLPVSGNSVVWKPQNAPAKGTYVLRILRGDGEVTGEIRVH